MTPPASAELPPGFTDRILARRTADLATRGLMPDAGTGAGDHLVFRAGQHLYGLRPGLVETVMRTAFHPVPLLHGPASQVVRGVFSRGGLPWSLVELTRLLQRPDADGSADPGPGLDGAGAGGKMLLLHGAPPRVALRVDHVLGVLALRVTDGEPGRLALLPSGASDAGLDPLVLLLQPRRLHDALAGLAAHDAAPVSPDPIGA